MPTEVEEFFRRILPNKGFPVITTLRKGSPPQQFSCESFGDFQRRLIVQKAKCDQQKRELYFGLSTLEQRAIVAEDGKYHVRVASNCRYIKVLVLDIDVDPSGYLKGDTNKPCYSTQEEAIAGLNAFCTRISFNKPVVVSSGYGLHVYWAFESHIDTNEWVMLAGKFKAVCLVADPRLVVDPTRVTDRAGILRVPGSLNYKNNEDPKPVAILDWGSDIPWPASFYSEHLDFFIQGNNVHLDLLPVRPVGVKLKKSSIVDLSVVYPDTEKADFKDIYHKCNWIGQYMREPAKRSEPEWKAMVDLSAYVKLTTKAGVVLEGVEMAKYLSKGYPGYSEAETITKYEQAQSNPTYTARTCASFQALDESRCRTCVFRDMVKTPLSLPKFSAPLSEIVVSNPIVIAGQLVATEERVFPRPPYPYEIGEDGGIYMRMKDSDGNKIAAKRIYEYTVIPVARILDENTGNELVEIEMKLPHNATKRFMILGGDFQDERTFRKALGNKGIYAQKGEMEALAKYLIAYAGTIQRSEPAKNNYNTFGWKERGTVDQKFVLYDCVIKQGGVIDEYRNTVQSLRDLGPHATSMGSIEEWKKAFAIYEEVEGMEPYIINLMLSFGAPLLVFLNEFGLIYNLYGSGGEGKSSSIYIATSVWGKPSVRHALAHDTVPSILDTLGTLASIPMAFDELTNMKAEALSDFAYTLSNGRGKNRLQQTGERRLNNYYWQTFVLTNSNNSLYGKLGQLISGNDAHGYRILELNSPPANSIVNQRMNEAKNILATNYGIAGKLFLQYVMENYEAVAAKVREARENINNTDRSKERYWVAAQACIQVAGYITKDLGLHNYDPGRLLEYMERMAPRSAVQSIAGDAVSKLNDYMMQNLNATIRVMDDNVAMLDLDLRNVNNIAIRLEGNGGVITKGYIPAGSIEKWCKMNETDVSWMRGELSRHKIMTRIIKKRLGAGTKYFSVSGNCWEVDMLHPMLTGLERKDVTRPNVVQIMGEVK